MVAGSGAAAPTLSTGRPRRPTARLARRPDGTTSTLDHVQRRIMGIETEFGVTCTFHGHRRLSPDEVARYLFRRVVSWGRSSNVFLRNGARLERIDWLGDTSTTGMRRSAGLMVNYVYRLDELERNHEVYRNGGKVNAGYDIEALAKKGTPAA